MSKVDGPPAKVIKYEMESQFLEGEVTDEGHEEWLSEEILTDEEYLAGDNSQGSSAGQSTQEVMLDDDDTPDLELQDGSLDGHHDSQDCIATASISNDSDEEPSILQNYTIVNTTANHTVIQQPKDNTMDTSESQTQNNKLRVNDPQNKSTDCESLDRTRGSSVSQNSTDTNIEETLNNFENARADSVTPDLPDDLDAYLIRKSAPIPRPVEPPAPPSPKKAEEDGGNDTDDLLQMLGESENKGKKKSQLTRKARQGKAKTKKAQAQKLESSDDDEYIFSGKSSSGKKLAAARSALRRQPASKAEPERCSDLSDSDALVKKMQPSVIVTKLQPARGQRDSAEKDTGTKKATARVTRLQSANQNQQPKSRMFFSTPIKTTINKHAVKQIENSSQQKTNTSKQKTNISQQKTNSSQQKTNISQQKTNISQQKTNISQQKVTSITAQKAASSQQKSNSSQQKVNSSQQKVNSSEQKVNSSQQKVNSSQQKGDSIQRNMNNNQQKANSVRQTANNSQQQANSSLQRPINSAKVVQKNKSLLKTPTKVVKFEKYHEKNLESDEESDEEEAHLSLLRDRLTCPEQMDEDLMSDEDSGSERDSFIDELPDSDSDGLEEWFTLDLRAERAGECLPMLGAKAHQVLQDEKRCVETRLSTLQSSLTSLTDSGKKQAEELRKASVRIAELDALLQTT